MSVSPLTFAGLVALAAVQRLLELWHSRRNLRRQSEGAESAGSTWHWSALVAFQAAWLLGCGLEPLFRGRVAGPVPLATGGALFLSGAALRVWCIRSLGASWNARGRVDPATRVVSTGPYRWIRHPNYLGVLLELVGLPLAGGAWITLAVMVVPHAWLLARRMRAEDALLQALPGYTPAMAGKGALLPRIGRLHAARDEG